jgi:hypothetical protein
MVYPMVQRVALASVEIDKKNTLESHGDDIVQAPKYHWQERLPHVSSHWPDQ